MPTRTEPDVDVRLDKVLRYLPNYNVVTALSAYTGLRRDEVKTTLTAIQEVLSDGPVRRE